MTIDLLTSGGRQAVIERLGQNAAVSQTLTGRLDDLVVRMRRDVTSIDWASDVSPVVNEATDHLLQSGKYTSQVSKLHWKAENEWDWENALALGENLEAGLDQVGQATRQAINVEAHLQRLALGMGEAFRGEQDLQLFSTPKPPKVIGEQQISIEAAAAEASKEIALVLGRLADKVLGRPRLSDLNVDVDDWRAAQTNEAILDWHLTKIAIGQHLHLDHTGDVINARKRGASWETIAEACGISADTARDRWESLIERIESKA